MKPWALLTVVFAMVALVMQQTLTTGPDGRTERLARAISVAEGYGVAGAIPTVRNNPGNIRDLSSGAIASYETPEAGWEALYKQVSRMIAGYGSLYPVGATIEQVALTYTGEAAYMTWANNVARYLGVPTSTPLQEV